MKKNILAIVGSASKESSNLKLVHYLSSLVQHDFSVTIFDSLSALPHFNPARTDTNTPTEIISIGNSILQADGIIICTPGYIFIPYCISKSICIIIR